LLEHQPRVLAQRVELDLRPVGLDGAQARIAPARYKLARWITSDDERELQRFIEANAHRVAYDVVGAPTFLAAHVAELTATQENWPRIKFHALREHAGLVFESLA